MIKNIVFDIGNVLADFRWKGFLEEKGFDSKMIERIAKASVLNPLWDEYDRGVWTDEQILQAIVDTDPEIEEELRKAFANFKNIVTKRDYTIPWIKDLKEKGYKVYYLSNFPLKALQDCPDALDFIPHMDGGILSYQDKVIKPDREIFELLLSRYELKAEECVFFDDLVKNVEGAKQVGIHGICFKNKEQAEKELHELLKSF